MVNSDSRAARSRAPGMFLRIAGLALLAGLVAVPAGAERRHAGAHEHGTGRLNVVLDGGTLVIELEGPTANFLGFEHAPRTPEQVAVMATATDSLRKGATLFSLDEAAVCRLTGAEVTPPDFSSGDGGDDHHDEHDDDHDQQHGHEAGADAAHSEFSAAWEFTCDKPAALKTIGVGVFAAFPRTEKLVTAVIGPAGQSGLTLTPASPSIRLHP